jgi:hypothetical protein
MKKRTLFEKRKRRVFQCLETVINKEWDWRVIDLGFVGPYRIDKYDEFNVVRKFDNNGFVLIFRFEYKYNLLIINKHYVSEHYLTDVMRFALERGIPFVLVSHKNTYSC